MIVAFFLTQGKNSLEAQLNELNFQKNTVYLILRGTDSKSGIIAKEYNQLNHDATHIGIGFFEKKFYVFHISDEMSNRNDNLFFEEVHEFINRRDLVYISIWKINGIPSQTYYSIVHSLKSSLQNSYFFDRKIQLDNDSLYCSEFVDNILKTHQLNIFRKNKIQLTNFPRIYLKRDSLEYLPVDGFMNESRVEKIFEWRNHK